MGHKDVQTILDIYADCTEDKKKEVIKNMEDKIFVSGKSHRVESSEIKKAHLKDVITKEMSG